MNRTILFISFSMIALFSLTFSGVGAFTYHPPFAPINFLISPEGLSAEFDPTLHTFIGEFGYEYQTPLENMRKRYLYVAIVNSNWDEGQTTKVYKLDLQNESVEIWLNDRPLVARIVVSSKGLRLENDSVEYLVYDGKMLRVDVSDGTINKISFHPESNLMQRMVGPETERNKFCRASRDRNHAPPLLMMVCLGDFMEMVLGVVPRFFAYIFGEIGGAIMGFWVEVGILFGIIWYIGKNSKPSSYIALSLLFIWVLLGMLRVWPDILF